MFCVMRVRSGEIGSAHSELISIGHHAYVIFLPVIVLS